MDPRWLSMCRTLHCILPLIEGTQRRLIQTDAVPVLWVNSLVMVKGVLCSEADTSSTRTVGIKTESVTSESGSHASLSAVQNRLLKRNNGNASTLPCSYDNPIVSIVLLSTSILTLFSLL